MIGIEISAEVGLTNADMARFRIHGPIHNRSLSQVVHPEATQSIGTKLIGSKYQISQEVLGGGGTGSVYRGCDLTSNTPVAIKRMDRAGIESHHELLEVPRTPDLSCHDEQV